jgi:hypothetical protein
LKKRPSFRLGKIFAVAFAVVLVILDLSYPITLTGFQKNPKIVYVVICIDTEMWGGHGQHGGSVNPVMDMRAYSRTSPLTVAAVFDSSLRNSHTDSYGTAFKITWFAEMDYLMAQGNFVWRDGSPAGVSGYTAIRDILVNNWGKEIQKYSDSIEYHHHFMTYNGTWKRYDNGPDAGYPGYQMYALDHMIIDDNFYPSSFRSGWLIMPPALSNWLEQWMPFDYTPLNGIWCPWHPFGMARWQTQSHWSLSQSDVNAAFERARDYGCAIYSFYCHDRDSMAKYIDLLQTYLARADNDKTAYPNVSFQYCTAREAMQLALGFTGFAPPTLMVTPTGGNYTIKSNEPLWKNHPYVALKYKNGTYMHMEATPAGTNTWTVTTAPLSQLEKIGVAASDLYGNTGVNVTEAVARVRATTHNFTLYGSYNHGWGFTASRITSLGPTIVVGQGDTVNLTLINNDGYYYTHRFFVSYTNASSPNSTEPQSSDCTTTLSYQFLATDTVGTYTYGCHYQYNVMKGYFQVVPTGTIAEFQPLIMLSVLVASSAIAASARVQRRLRFPMRVNRA